MPGRKPTAEPATRARRMSPEARREQILDSAVSYIVERGLSTFTLENVAHEAGVSKPLVYKYFTRREDLLRAVMEREYVYLGSHKLDVLPDDVPLEPLIRASNRNAFNYLYERGPVIRLLAGDRSVAELVHQRERNERSAITEHFIKRLMKTYGVPKDVAFICTVMTVNAPILSSRALKRAGITAERAAQVWSDFAMGGWHALQAQQSDAGKPPVAKTVKPKAAKAKAAAPASKRRKA
ncbi:TetR/AcrR family transcriptional regulator [Piscinibacter gummiphilus]|uniref:TetR/AcrR family transcriptional regulator n=1 Tax=Piscinibacter gummiphilus TaxID=946333 RepID=A0ABZ0CM09_9BURK|nr:TetR/AcrR family transcriptional regulator [Piscinibacter gummiphilus]WOB06019.1 TetR/AcrR family transcriptional regulator [Piscinibacter gummiphilus]